MNPKKIGLFAASLLLGGALLVESPEALQAAECEGPGEILCEEHESCVSLIFAKFCSKEYEYYASEEDGGMS